MCEYPYILETGGGKKNMNFFSEHDGNKSTINNTVLDPFNTITGSLPGVNMQGNRTITDIKAMQGYNNSKTNYGAWNKLTKSDLVVRQATILDENRIVLYKRGKQISEGYYIVEISTNNS